MSFVKVADIKPGQNNMRIRVRICRMWRGKILKPIEHDDSLHIILVDKHNDAIHAIVREADYEDVSGKVVVGCIYNITKFYSKDSQKQYKVVPHETQLVFNNRTLLEVAPDVYPPLPRHRFYFVDYNDLLDRRNNDDLLTDVIGRVRIVQPVEETTVDGRVTKRRHIHIQNTSKELMRVTLWGSMAENFQADVIGGMTPPVVIVFTSLKVRVFQSKAVLNGGMSTCVFLDPAVPETAAYKACFVQQNNAPKIPTSAVKMNMDAADVKSVEKVKVADLNLLHPVNDKDLINSCRARITKFNIRDGWFYMACPSCSRQMQPKDGSGFSCKDHQGQDGLPLFRMELRLEDDTDSVPVILIGRTGDNFFGVTCEKLVKEHGYTDRCKLPPILEEFMGKYYIWRVGFGNRDDLIVKAVYPDCGDGCVSVDELGIKKDKVGGTDDVVTKAGFPDGESGDKDDDKVEESFVMECDDKVGQCNVPDTHTPKKKASVKRNVQKTKDSTLAEVLSQIVAKKAKKGEASKFVGKEKKVGKARKDMGKSKED